MADPISATFAAIASAATAATAATASALIGLGVGTATAKAIASFVIPTLINAGLSIAASALLAPSVNAEGSPTEWRPNPNAGIPVAIGRVATAGSIIHMDEHGPDNRYLTIANLLSVGPIDAIESFRADRVAVTFSGTSATSPAEYANKMFLSTSTGVSGTALSVGTLPHGTASLAGWGAQSTLPGLAHTLWTLYQDSKFKSYPQGAPSPLHILRGVKVYDPRKDSTYPGGSGAHRLDDASTWEFSKNPGLHAIAWALGHKVTDPNTSKVFRIGIGATASGIHWPAFVELANVCDANDWEVSALPTSADDPHQVLKAILQAGGARYASIAGKISCIARTPRTSTVTVSAADTAGAFEIEVNADRLVKRNTITPRCVQEDHDWQMTPQAAVTVAQYVTDDGGELAQSLDFPYVAIAPASANKDQPEQLAAYAMLDSRESIIGTVPFRPHMAQVEPGDVFTVDEPGFLLDGVELLCLQRTIDAANNVVQLTFMSESAGKHTFALGLTNTPPTPPGLTAPDIRDIPAPAADIFTVTPGAGQQPTIALTVTNADAAQRAYVVEYRPTTDGAGSAITYADDATGWEVFGQFDISTESVVLTGLEPNTSYQIAIRYVSEFGILGTRRILATVTTGAMVADDAVAVGGLTRDEIDAAFELSKGDTDFTAETLMQEVLGRRDDVLRRKAQVFETFGTAEGFLDAALVDVEAARAAAQTALQTLVDDGAAFSSAAETSATNAATSAGAASASAGAASTSATQASQSASGAAGSASSASISAAAAATSANAAGASATAAATEASSAATFADNAQQFSIAASTSATNAATSASGASTSATQASQSATNAAGSASAASTSATTAAASATTAAGHAVAALSSRNDANLFKGQAETAQTAASLSATDAEGSASAASLSATAAATSQGAAAGSASAAATSASTATTAANSAETFAGAASTSATNAQTSAGSASTSATQASTSATEAAGSASAALTSETNASTSAGQASTSASQASTSAGEAASSALAANTSASTAAGHATTAQTAASTATTQAAAASISATLSAQYGASAKQDMKDAETFFTMSNDALDPSVGSIAPSWTNSYRAADGYHVTTVASPAVLYIRRTFGPTPGRRYRVTASWRYTSGVPGTVYVGFNRMNPLTNASNTVAWGAVTAGAINEWRDASFEVTADASVGAGELWKPVFYRAGSTGELEVRSLVWQDLTSSRAAGEDTSVVYSTAEEAFSARFIQTEVDGDAAGIQLSARKADGTTATEIRQWAQLFRYGKTFGDYRFEMDFVNNRLVAWNTDRTHRVFELDFDTDGRLRLRNETGTLLFDSENGGVQKAGINPGALGTQGIAFENRHYFLPDNSTTRTAAQATSAFIPLAIETDDIAVPASEWVSVRGGITMKASSDMFGHFNGRFLLVRIATYPTAGAVATTLAEDTPHFSVGVNGFWSSGNRRTANKAEPQRWAFEVFDRPPQNGGEDPTAVKYRLIVTSETISGGIFEAFNDNNGARRFFGDGAFINAVEAASGPVSVDVRLSNSAPQTLPTAPAVTVIAGGSNLQWN